jgi:hypothetical protein
MTPITRHRLAACALCAASLAGAPPAFAIGQPLDDESLSATHGRFGEELLGSPLTGTLPAEQIGIDAGVLLMAQHAQDRTLRIGDINRNLGDLPRSQPALALPLMALAIPFVGLPMLPLLPVLALVPPQPRPPQQQPGH